MTAPVSLLDYGVGNLGSVRNMFRRLGVEAEDVTAPADIACASRLLLPGVGSFDHGMTTLEQGGWAEGIRAHVAAGRPLLGICLGMQLLLNTSEEGNEAGLGFIGGTSHRFTARRGLPVPHMGWNHAIPTRQNPLFAELDAEARYYFVHSYYVSPDDEQHVLARSTYGHGFASAIAYENVYGAQFHPEKSHRYGMQLLENFSRL